MFFSWLTFSGAGRTGPPWCFLSVFAAFYETFSVPAMSFHCGLLSLPLAPFPRNTYELLLSLPLFAIPSFFSFFFGPCLPSVDPEPPLFVHLGKSPFDPFFRRRPLFVGFAFFLLPGTQIFLVTNLLNSLSRVLPLPLSMGSGYSSNHPPSSFFFPRRHFFLPLPDERKAPHLPFPTPAWNAPGIFALQHRPFPFMLPRG